MTVVSQVLPGGVPRPGARARPVNVALRALGSLVVFGLSAVGPARVSAQPVVVSRPPEVSIVTEKAVEKASAAVPITRIAGSLSIDQRST